MAPCNGFRVELPKQHRASWGRLKGNSSTASSCFSPDVEKICGDISTVLGLGWVMTSSSTQKASWQCVVGRHPVLLQLVAHHACIVDLEDECLELLIHASYPLHTVPSRMGPLEPSATNEQAGPRKCTCRRTNGWREVNKLTCVDVPISRSPLCLSLFIKGVVMAKATKHARHATNMERSAGPGHAYDYVCELD